MSDSPRTDQFPAVTARGAVRLLAALMLLTTTSLAAVGYCAAAGGAGPVGVIQRFQDTLLSVMKQAKALGYEGRYKKLAPVVTATHDLETIARVSVGQYWGKLSDAQRSKLVDTFSRLSIATYAARFDGYSGETFSAPTLGRQNAGRALVRTELTTSDGETISFVYQMHKSGDAWHIVNIITNGVSDLAMKRAEYTSVIEKDGFDSLISKLEQKIEQYRKEPPA